MVTTETCASIRKTIEASYSRDIPAITAVLLSLPLKLRSSSACGKQVTLEAYPTNIGSGVPIGAAWVGCESAVPQVMNAVLLEGVKRGLVIS